MDPEPKGFEDIGIDPRAYRFFPLSTPYFIDLE